MICDSSGRGELVLKSGLKVHDAAGVQSVREDSLGAGVFDDEGDGAGGIVPQCALLHLCLQVSMDPLHCIIP